jgi:dihydroxyacetone kinase-like predicted kinase
VIATEGLTRRFGDLVAVDDSPARALEVVLEKAGLDRAEILTIYYGADTDIAEAQEVGAAVRCRYPALQVEVVRGGQPHYNYIASVE